jgi:hypothetical protein
MTLFAAPSRPAARLAGLVVSSALLFTAAAALGADTLPHDATPPQKVALRGGNSWAKLTPAQRTALAPLQQEWNTLGPENRAKWLQVAARYPGMSEAERVRMQARMEAWSRLSPQERGQARLRYQEAQTVPPQERRERWEQYQALPAEQRRQLSAGSRGEAATRKPDARGNATAPRSGGRSLAQMKSNVVPSTSPAVPPKAVAPAIVQAKPGATTNLISRPPRPPSHQQSGLPKIAATPGLVDRTTLLPKRSPQGAAAPPKASAGEPDKKQ